MVATGVDAVGTGTFVSASAILFTRFNDVSVSAMGLGLTLSALTGMFASVPVAQLADRQGSLRVFTLAYLARAIGMLAWSQVSGPAAFIVFAAAFGIVDRSAASLTRSLIISPLSREQGVALLGRIALPANLGYGVGAALSALALYLHLAPVVIFGLNAASFVVVVLLYRYALAGEDTTAARVKRSILSSPGSVRTAFADSRRRRVLAENFFFSFHRTLLSVYLPLVVIAKAPELTWAAPLIFILNAATVGFLQERVNILVHVGGRHVLAWGVSGILIGLTIGAAVFMDRVGGNAARAVVLLLVFAQIAAEMLQSAALSVYMVELSRREATATDLSAINMGGQLQNIVGPLLFTALLVGQGWLLTSLCAGIVLAAAVRVLVQHGERATWTTASGAQ